MRGGLRAAAEAWSAGKLDRNTLRGCRHTFASPMIAAGLGAQREPDASPIWL
jgi:hypothetical protein